MIPSIEQLRDFLADCPNIKTMVKGQVYCGESLDIDLGQAAVIVHSALPDDPAGAVRVSYRANGPAEYALLRVAILQRLEGWEIIQSARNGLEPHVGCITCRPGICEGEPCQA